MISTRLAVSEVRTTLLISTINTPDREVSIQTKTQSRLKKITGSDGTCLLGSTTISPPSTAVLSPPSSSAATADFSELEGHSSMAPGARAERGRGAIPAAVLRPPQMLDGTPVTATMPKRPSSLGSTSRSSAFKEHISEMEDTVRLFSARLATSSPAKIFYSLNPPPAPQPPDKSLRP